MSSRKKKKLYMRSIKTVLLLSSFVIVCVFVSFAVSSISSIKSKYKEKAELSIQLDNLKEKELELTLNVEKLQDPEYIARYLRERFLYSKEEEVIIKLPKK